uniref:DNA-directed RNA polymerase subunit n=1 Tax=Nephromyces sp. ex Molgula occidentalis TaxID=2544991 RepID=A0A5C1H888_9APIC|nr:plastid-encoded DNA-directed RNA polymerase beta' [Nephromyces sp. ex Molgula occidentalis]
MNKLLFKISVSSPETICLWATRTIMMSKIIAEVTEPVTINFKTQQYEKNGLFWEKLFGPTLSWTCKWGLYTGLNTSQKESFWENCGSEINTSNIRRFQMGFISLNTPIIHIWYLKGPGKILSHFLNIPSNQLEIMFSYNIFFRDQNLLTYLKNTSFKTLLEVTKFTTPIDYLFNFTYIDLLNINEILFKKLQKLNLIKELNKWREELIFETRNIEKLKLSQKARYLHLFFISKLRPEWIFLTKLPILPPELRPFLKLDLLNNYLISPLNNLYRLILIKNNRLKRWSFFKNTIPAIFETIEKKMLQQSINSLIQPNLHLSNKIDRPILSLSTFLKGKYGRFRQNLLGKRVDFSGRSVIVSGPDLTIGTIGLPYDLALNLFHPLLLNILFNKFKNINKVNLLLKYRPRIIKYILKKILTKKIILLNRAPTLHKMNLQAFKPYLIEGESLRLFPLACSSFNADFDGDQMGIFVPISNISQYEAKYKMSSDKNFFSHEKNKNLFKMSQNIILGLYILMIGHHTFNNLKLYFLNNDDVLYTYYNNLLFLNSFIWVKYKLNLKFKTRIQFILTTPGKILLNESTKSNYL